MREYNSHIIAHKEESRNRGNNPAGNRDKGRGDHRSRSRSRSRHRDDDHYKGDNRYEKNPRDSGRDREYRHDYKDAHRDPHRGRDYKEKPFHNKSYDS